MNRKHRVLQIVVAAAMTGSADAHAQVTLPAVNDTPRLSALEKMPVREITVFKDGHAFVLHEGTMPVDTGGNVLLDYLPTPVIGTFWPYSANPNIKLTSVVASQRRLLVDRTALSIRELLEANVGASVVITEYQNVKYSATILAVPARSAAELDATGPLTPPGGQSGTPGVEGQHLPQKGNIILLKSDEGIRALPIERIQDVTFKTTPNALLANEEQRNLLTLKLNWGNLQPARKAPVGMVYLQKGLRWIPNYRITLDGKGKALVKLQATLLNELTDLDDVTANLVIGVPTFAFKDTPDPISLQQAMAQLSRYFESDARSAYGFSNAIMTQQARMGEYRVANMPGAPGPMGSNPEIAGANQNEDLFVFTVRHISLKKGQRMVLPVAEYSLPYKDVYTLDLPLAPPADIYRSFNSNQQTEIARLLAAPRVTHKIRLTNKNIHPLSTAPALIESGGRLLAQGLMTYTAIGSDTDLDVTTAVDITVTKNETETKRTPNAMEWQNNQFMRVDVAGKLLLCSYKNEPVELEITRQVFGEIDSATHNGDIKKLSVFDDSGALSAGGLPTWWNWYDSGGWWQRLNGLGRINWKVRLEPKKEIQLGYTYHYFWR